MADENRTPEENKTSGTQEDSRKTPQWLIDTQNKSWEPEILISGITLTFIFLLSDQVYNFCGMLIQHYGAYSLTAHVLYGILLVMLTGMKLILIVHLIFRGLWTGLVGLSYVFPKGVDREKLPKSERHKIFESPAAMVIRIERICSLLFAFVFWSLSFLFVIMLSLSPAVILFFLRLSYGVIRIINVIYAITLVTVPMLLVTVFKESRFSRYLFTSVLVNIKATFSTNLSQHKSRLVFVAYFLIIIAINVSSVIEFRGFWNRTNPGGVATQQGMVKLDADHYESERDTSRRVQRAEIDSFRVHGSSIELFIAYYDFDGFSVDKMRENFSQYKKYLADADSSTKDTTKGDNAKANRTKASFVVIPDSTGVPDSTSIAMSDMYTIWIDDIRIPGLQWYLTEKPETGQRGLSTTVPLSDIGPGYHELRIEKTFWKIKEKGFISRDKWEIIPFEKAP